MTTERPGHPASTGAAVPTLMAQEMAEQANAPGRTAENVDTQR